MGFSPGPRFVGLRHTDRTEKEIPLSLNRVIDYVEPAKNAVKDHPKNGMIDAPGNGYGQDTSEAPATYAR